MPEVISAGVSGELVALFRREFELCNVREAERVLVTYDAATRPDYVEASVGALSSLGATAVPLRLPGISQISMRRGSLPAGVGDGARAASGSGVGSLFVGNSPSSRAVGAMVSAVDMVVDLVRLEHAPGRVEALAAGRRMLTIVEPPDALERMLPTPELKASCLAAADLLRSAERMHVTSPAGTDFVAELDPDLINCQCGFADEPGRWDGWPSGFVATFARPGSATGEIVLDVGDMVLDFYRYVESPVTFKIDRGYVTSVGGTGLDAALVRHYLHSWGDPETLAVSHIGWGMNPKARWEALQLYADNQTHGQDGRALLGGFMWSTGPTPYAQRFVPGHLDIPMIGCSVFLDGEPIVENGRVVHPGLAGVYDAYAPGLVGSPAKAPMPLPTENGR